MSTDRSRSYEVYQRQTERDIPVVIPPGFSLAPEFVADPYPMLARLRDNYPCFRDWYTNTWWVTRYDDVTSLIADDASFTSRPRRLAYGADVAGQNLRDEPAVRNAFGHGMQHHAAIVAEESLHSFATSAGGDLIADYVGPFTEELLARVIGVPKAESSRFSALWRAVDEGVGWHAGRQDRGRQAMTEMGDMLAKLIAQKRLDPSDDVLSALLIWQADASDVELADHAVATLLEVDLRTLEGSLANLLCLLMIHPDQHALVREDDEMLIRAWQETMRHSPPITEAHHYTTREVERFGMLLPNGGLVVCSAAAANRDPQTFSDADSFDITRKDLAYREPRGQFRIDGLPAGVAPGLAPLSKLPARPADRPPSHYALTAEAVVAAAGVLIAEAPLFRLDTSWRPPQVTCRWPGDVRTCRQMVVRAG